MLKSKNSEGIWKIINENTWAPKIEGIVDKTVTKFFWIMWKETKKRYAFVKAARIYNSKILSGQKCWKDVLVSKIMASELKTEWIAFEIFLQYFIEKYWNTNVIIVPAELDYNHKVDCIIPSWKTKFWFDIKIWSNWSGKREKILEHAKNLDNPEYIPSNIQNSTPKNIKDFKNSKMNVENYSPNFLYQWNWIIRVNSLSEVTKLIKKYNFLLEAYNNYIKGDWKKEIEKYIPEKILEEFIFIWTIIPEAIKSAILFLKWNKDQEEINLPKNFWTIKIKRNVENTFIDIAIFQWRQTKSFCDLFIPITNTLLKSI